MGSPLKDRNDAAPEAMQRSYWDSISAHYQRVMEISTDDFHYGPMLPGDSSLKLLPEIGPGMRALELGCGGGQNSVYLAKRGAVCDAFDISSEQLAAARALARREGVRIRFSLGKLDAWPSSFSGPYDLIHSSHAMEFTDDPAGVVAMAGKALAPGGSLVISTVHPLYNGEWVDGLDENGGDGGKGLFLRNYFSPPDDVRRRNGKPIVFSHAYPVSAWFRWMRDAGLEVTAIEEPPEAPEGAPYYNDDWADNDGELAAIPATLIVRARRAGAL
ncbi:MAG: class I SAM-dependent methyltransferase [Kiritimatiellae bacterium]|nr:class I SAM-dependent methyltransferase [Kiritimatiellia bacterium]